MSTTAPTEVPTEAPQPRVTAEAEKKPQDALFKWQAWVHVGEGADACPDARTGCARPEHFHAWCRLPNPFQVRDITDKAQAARARYQRLLRDPNSDAAVLLEDKLEELRDSSIEMLVDELVDKHFADDYTAAVRATDDLEDMDWEPGEGEEEGDRPKLWATIDQDREEWMRQQLLPEEQRDETFAVLEANVAEYGRALDKHMKALQEPRRTELMATDKDELIALLRHSRIEATADEQYLHWYNTWQWFICTYKPRADGMPPNERVWSDINKMKQEAPPEVIFALRDVFDGLESHLAASRRGKDS